MNESNTKILYTEDYGQFHFLSGNRDLNESKINRIMKDVQDGMNFFKYNPINVNEQNYIIDGQHRFVACKMLKLPVYYVIVPNVPLSQISRLNNNQSRWTTRDFMNCYIDANVNREHYSILKEFVEKYKVSISTAINLLSTGKIGAGGNTETFRDGEFQVNFYDLAKNTVETASEYAQFTNEFHSRSFLQAIEILIRSEKYEHDKIIAKLAKHDLSIDKCGSHKEYLKQIEELYNYRNSIRQVIY